MPTTSWLPAKHALELRIMQGTPQPIEPEALMLSEIERADLVFQHRLASEWASHKHVQELLKSLKNTKGSLFDALTVFWVGDAWMLIDGHHRYEAYERFNFSLPVPVRAFMGTLDEAIGEALKTNTHDKLSMSASEKTNATWRLVIGSSLSINQTIQISGSSRQTVVTMRKTRDEILGKTAPGFIGTMTWPQARRWVQGRELQPEHDQDYLDKQAQALANRLTKAFGNELSRYPEVLWRALEIYDITLQDAFYEYHGYWSEDGEAEGAPTEGDLENSQNGRSDF